MPKKSKSKKTKVSKSILRKYFVEFWTLVRLSAVILLWTNVIVGYIINIFLDAVDGDILERLKAKRDNYETWDKWLDLWFYTALLFYIVTQMPHNIIWFLLIGLYFYRLIGSVWFSLSEKEWLLLIFPNIFTELFIIYTLFPWTAEINYYLPGPWPLMTALVIFSLAKEWWIHIAKIDCSDLLTGKTKHWK